jgi:hypothetical protein
MSDLGGFAALLILGFLAISLYLLPTTVAIRRKHPNVVAIFVFNTLLGWSFIGWAVAMVWAFSNTRVVTPGAPPPGAKTPNNPASANGQATAEQLKPCPFCAEPIKLAAIKCKHCGSMLGS